jgi:hypothetical protein
MRKRETCQASDQEKDENTRSVPRLFERITDTPITNSTFAELQSFWQICEKERLH